VNCLRSRFFVLAVLFSVSLLNSAAAPPKAKAPLAAAFSPGGERLPVPEITPWENDPRNYDWKIIARALHVRDLRVRQWPTAYNIAGEPERIKRRLKSQLHAAGYKVKDTALRWNTTGNLPASSSFRAQRGTEVLAGLWTSNGSYLFLYWGHQTPRTAAQIRNDNLIAAALAGKEAAAKNLLQQGADPRAIDYGGDSVLEIAAAFHRVNILRYLLAARTASISAADVGAALDIAAGSGDADAVQVFLDAGATRPQIDAALLVAARYYDGTKTAKRLAPRASQTGIDNALILAAFVEEWRGSAIQYPDTVEVLLKHSPSQNALDQALIAAAYDDEARLVPVLLKAGAGVEARDAEGKTALMRTAGDFYYDALQQNVRFLLEAGADIEARDKEGNTPLIVATRQNWHQTIAFLLKHGADPTARNASGQTALYWLARRVENLKWNSPEAEQFRALAQQLRDEISRRSR
jgi:ankyrin repeat protein